MRDFLERFQVALYFAAVAGAAVIGLDWPEALTPALAFMLFVTFLQVPMGQVQIGRKDLRFLGALFVSNFLVIPLLVAALLPFAPEDFSIRLGILLVLLTPCIDYVITFAHLGRADARLLLMATPFLLLGQMLLLPLYLRIFLGDGAHTLLRFGPFLETFVWLLAVPLLCATGLQIFAQRSRKFQKITKVLGFFPVPATALVLFLVVSALLPVLGAAKGAALSALPLYLAFAIVVPGLGWAVARAFRLSSPAARAVSFSSATRNALVILPLALALPDAMPVLAAVIVTQTFVELVAQLFYIRLLPLFGQKRP